MDLTAALEPARRQHVDTRLATNLMAWLSTVSPAGRPDTVPVWFLAREDGTFLLYSQPRKLKLRNIDANPNVALGLDVTDIGRDIIRITGTAELRPDIAPAHEVPEFVAKYVERIGAILGTPQAFGTAFSEPIVITPNKFHA